MTTVNHSWIESRGGSKAIISNKTFDVTCENPWVGMQLSDFQRNASETDGISESFYALAYLVEEYGEGAIEEVAEMDEAEQKEFVGEIEDRLHEQK
ncbi:hypothetical protein GJ633_08175 [Halorubrum sp. CBA1125]|uniref:hypothetical protein n=1 Tax=Halorubrum sp. CBA1125 TaxID=2668072 RepID=UPI0012E8B802|nr:hypothetical protein [Halorubrum sp. CBA1125]MUW14646.1 hypothetical protein [Halorubrum sp. CBA1125]